MEYRLVNQRGHETISVFLPDGEVCTATDTHPRFTDIKDALIAGSEDADEIRGLFDLAYAAQAQFLKVSDRVSIKDGKVYLDYEEVDSSLTRTILQFLNDGLDFTPLVNFFEQIQANPQPHSREQLFEWLRRHDFAITHDGHFIAYKSVHTDDKHGYASVSAGKAIVNGQEHDNGRVPNPVGAVVEFPRHEVVFDPSQGCGVGLHAGSWEYAEGFSGDTLLKVKINPRDVVSVPTDSDWQKLRVCRYVVLDVTEKKFEQIYYPEQEEFDFEDDEFTNESKLLNELEDDDLWTDEEKANYFGGNTPAEAVDAPTVEELSQPDVPFLGVTQARVLEILDGAVTTLKIKEVADEAEISRDAAKNALYRLVNKGLADFGESHRLSKTFRITDEGDEVAEIIRERV